MTPATGKRSYRACLRCRRRKTKCNLDKAGGAKKPPCESCHRSGSECVLVQSRRGGRFRPRPTATSPTAAVDEEDNVTVPHNVPRLASTPIEHSSVTGDDYERQTAGQDLHLELRNPSDALEILAHAGETRAKESSVVSASEHISMAGASPAPATRRNVEHRNNERSDGEVATTSALDDYELVQRGLILPDTLPELLYMFARKYHPYCPIVPSYMLGSQAMTRIQRSDYFLLTVILAIASRDSPNHALTHRYCWDHAQRLLLDVLLAYSWAQNLRTVQALLLLAEWLPHHNRRADSEAPKSLVSEDQTAWSLVGLAVRQGYLLRLDQSAFRNTGDNNSLPEREEERRLVWTFIYLADRQISVRMGQSFWSRGPSLSSPFTSKDYPSLKALPGLGHEDLASGMGATLDLTQILYNAHGILYSSTTRTLAMVHDGDYARYLDDLQRATTSWYSTWGDIQLSKRLKATLLLMASNPRQAGSSSGVKPLTDVFSRGIASSPDGHYIFGAIDAARNLLGLMNDLSPQRVLRYLPTRYYLYGVYAAVFLHKAQSAGAFLSAAQKREIPDLAIRFISQMEAASADESHLCRRYSSMLKKLWYRREASLGTLNDGQLPPGAVAQEVSAFPPQNVGSTVGSPAPPMAAWPPRRPQDEHSELANSWDQGAIGLQAPPDAVHLGSDIGALPSVEGYLYGSFFPGITDLNYPMGFGDGVTI